MDDFGPFGLFLSSFLAATILPFSSEVALISAVELGMSTQDALLFASIGNCMAVLVNYFLGLFLYQLMHERIHNSGIGRYAYKIAHRHGYWALLLSPLPLIGDPITIVSGLVRLHIVYFILITFSLRIFRYWFILTMIE